MFPLKIGHSEIDNQAVRITAGVQVRTQLGGVRWDDPAVRFQFQNDGVVNDEIQPVFTDYDVLIGDANQFFTPRRSPRVTQ